MECCLIATGKDTGAFKGNIDAFFLPWQFCRVAHSMNLDRAIANINRIAFDLYFLREATMDAVIAQQMRIGFHWTKIVDCDDLNIGAARFDDSAKNITADAAKTIDSDADCHFQNLRTGFFLNEMLQPIMWVKLAGKQTPALWFRRRFNIKRRN